MHAQTIVNYGRAASIGSKYVYETIPRMLTLWLDLVEKPKAKSHPYWTRIENAIAEAVVDVPAYKARSPLRLSRRR